MNNDLSQFKKEALDLSIDLFNLIEQHSFDIECSWLLYETTELIGDHELKQKVADIACKMAMRNLKGLDIDGGLMNEEFPSTNTFDTEKHWWPQAEALVGYFNAYQILGDTLFLETVKQSWNFIRKYMLIKKMENGMGGYAKTVNQFWKMKKWVLGNVHTIMEEFVWKCLKE